MALSPLFCHSELFLGGICGQAFVLKARKRIVDKVEVDLQDKRSVVRVLVQ
jgi:hypothetical protein